MINSGTLYWLVLIVTAQKVISFQTGSILKKCGILLSLMVLKVAGGCRKTRIVKILAQKSKYFGIYFAQVADNSKTYNYKFYGYKVVITEGYKVNGK